jgi:ssRNA-specific RNase YbeY (16S rRNA maturation enzyme)
MPKIDGFTIIHNTSRPKRKKKCITDKISFQNDEKEEIEKEPYLKEINSFQ